MNKKIFTIGAGALSCAVVLGGVMMSGNVFAQTEPTMRDSYISTLSEKLGVSETKLEDAMTQSRESMHQEREVLRDSAIANALKAGTLTQREVDILNAMHEIREAGRTERMASGERGLKRGMVNMLEDINKSGLKVTQEELDNLHEKMVDIDLGFGGQRGKGMGMRMGI